MYNLCVYKCIAFQQHEHIVGEGNVVKKKYIRLSMMIPFANVFKLSIHESEKKQTGIASIRNDPINMALTFYGDVCFCRAAI